MKRPGKSVSRKRELRNRRAALKRKAKIPSPFPRSASANKPADWAAGEDYNARAEQPSWPPNKIKIGIRHRKDLGDIKALAADINERGLLHPIVVDLKCNLIAGERRLAAWKISNFRDQAIPIHTVPLTDLISGEWAENDPRLRQNFTPSETVEIKRAIERKLKPAAQLRIAHGKTAPGRSAKVGISQQGSGDRAAAFTGKSRRTVEKAEQIVDAARDEPEKYGRLKDDMDKSGRVDGPFKRLQNMKAAEAIRNSPAPLPGNGPYSAGMIDFPHAGEPDGDDPNRVGRGYYPYPTMNTAQQIEFMREHVDPLLAPDCTVGFWTTNYHLTFGHHLPVLEAIGLLPRVTLSFCKDIVGRGQVARGTVEFLVIASRGDVVIETFPRTDFPFKVNTRHHSRKDQTAFDLFAKHVPASRYFSLFETAARGDKWDCHGNKIPLSPPPRAFVEVAAPPGMRMVLDAIERGVATLVPDEHDINIGRADTFDFNPNYFGILNLIAGKKKLRLTKLGRERLADLSSAPQSDPDADGAPALLDAISHDEELKILEVASSGQIAWSSELAEQLKKQKLIAGNQKWRLTVKGRGRLAELRRKARDAAETSKEAVAA